VGLKESVTTISEIPDKVVITLTFTGEKSGQLVYYTAESEPTGAVDVQSVTELMIEDAYTWYGITPP